MKQLKLQENVHLGKEAAQVQALTNCDSSLYVENVNLSSDKLIIRFGDTSSWRFIKKIKTKEVNNVLYITVVTTSLRAVSGQDAISVQKKYASVYWREKGHRWETIDFENYN